MAAYQQWFATPIKPDAEVEEGFPPDMPRYVKHTGGIPFDQVKSLMKLRTGSHYLALETGRWKNPRVPRDERLCEMCPRSVVEDEFHLLFECPAYDTIRAKYDPGVVCPFWRESSRGPHHEAA